MSQTTRPAAATSPVPVSIQQGPEALPDFSFLPHWPDPLQQAPWQLALHSSWRVLSRTVRRSLGLHAAMDTADRVVLEQCIFPHYRRRDDVKQMLFVGTRWYTRHYPALLGGKRFITIDVDRRAARHGSPQGHITASAAEVRQHFGAGSLDLVMFNGVFGWGLDRLDEMEQSIAGFHEVLRPGGELVVGWNDVPRRRPFDWHALPALQRFSPLPFGPLGGVSSIDLPTDNRHRFEFYRKPPQPG